MKFGYFRRDFGQDGRIALNWAGEAQEVALRKRSAPAKPPDPTSGRQFVPNQATGPIDSKYGNWRPEHDHTPTDRHGALLTDTSLRTNAP